MNTKQQNPEVRIQKSEWKTSEPPRDGSIIVAVGRVIMIDGERTIIDPFCAAIQWDNGFGGWVFHIGDKMAIVSDPSDKVAIDFWNEYPVSKMHDVQGETLVSEDFK